MEYESPDGTRWTVEVTSPGASNAIVAFRHPNRATSRQDRYAWYLHSGDKARDVSARLDPKKVLEALTGEDLARLFRVSMPINTNRGPFRGLSGVDAEPEALDGMGGTHAPAQLRRHDHPQAMGVAALFQKRRDSGLGTRG